MSQRKATVDRLGMFSDSVFAVTIMVLDLKPPDHPTFAALLPLWPNAADARRSAAAFHGKTRLSCLPGRTRLRTRRARESGGETA